jgi:hypothetical protein
MTTNNPNAELEPEHPFRNQRASLQEIFDAMQACYALADACEPGDQDIYVLESPHLHEMMYRRMLAGDSGFAFSQCLSDGENIEVPFGLFGVEPWKPKPDSLRGIGAINACSFPMQADTYGPARSSLPGLNKAVDALGKVRSRPGVKRIKKYRWVGEFEKLMVDALFERIMPLVASRVRFHPCGEVARVLMEKVQERIKLCIRNDNDVDFANFEICSHEKPHPSFNAWRNLSLSGCQIRRAGGMRDDR